MQFVYTRRNRITKCSNEQKRAEAQGSALTTSIIHTVFILNIADAIDNIESVVTVVHQSYQSLNDGQCSVQGESPNK